MGRLEGAEDELRCVDAAHSGHFPVIDGVPVLINEAQSVFSIDDHISRRATTISLLKPSRHSVMIREFIPGINRRIKSRSNFERFANLLFSQSSIRMSNPIQSFQRVTR